VERVGYKVSHQVWIAVESQIALNKDINIPIIQAIIRHSAHLANNEITEQVMKSIFRYILRLQMDKTLTLLSRSKLLS
jgi:hypothetical protein